MRIQPSRQFDTPTSFVLRNEVPRAWAGLKAGLFRGQCAECDGIATRPPDDDCVVRGGVDDQELRLRWDSEAGGARRERSELDGPRAAGCARLVQWKCENSNRPAGSSGAGRVRDQDWHVRGLYLERRTTDEHGEEERSPRIDASAVSRNGRPIAREHRVSSRSHTTTAARPPHACRSLARLYPGARRIVRSNPPFPNPRAHRTPPSANRRPSPLASTR
jgi:hypothetical protein